MSGQPVKTKADINRFRNEYMETLAIQAAINDMNLQANKTYLLTGQLPPQSQMQDTRTNAEKLADVEKMKRDIADGLRPIAEPQFAYQIVNAVIDSPLNLNNSLLRFLAQRVDSIVSELQRIYKIGIAGDANDLEKIVNTIKDMYAKQNNSFQSVKSYLNTTNSIKPNAIGLSANNLDDIKLKIQDIIKNIYVVSGGNKEIQRYVDPILFIIKILYSLLPTTYQVQLYLDAITTGIPVASTFREKPIKVFFDFLEELPTYDQVITLLTRIKQSVKANQLQLVKEGLSKLQEMFAAVYKIMEPKNKKVFDDFTEIVKIMRGLEEMETKKIPKRVYVPTSEGTTTTTTTSEEPGMRMLEYGPSYEPETFSDVYSEVDVSSLDPSDYDITSLSSEVSIPKAVQPIIQQVINQPQEPENPQERDVLIDDFAKQIDIMPVKVLQQILIKSKILNAKSANQSKEKIKHYLLNTVYPSEPFLTRFMDAMEEYESQNLFGEPSMSPEETIENKITETVQQVQPVQQKKPDKSKEQTSTLGKNPKDYELGFDIYEPITSEQDEILQKRVDILKSYIGKLSDENAKKIYHGIFKTNTELNLWDYKRELILSLVNAIKKDDYSDIVKMDIKGFGIKKRRGRPRGSGITQVEKPPTFIGFGINEINQRKLKDGILKIRRNTRTSFQDMPSKRISPTLQRIIKTVVGGGMPNYNDLSSLNEEEKEYLHKIVTRSNMEDKLSIPAPSKDQQEKDIHNFEVMKGQIMSGNDSIELVKKFKLLIRKLAKQGLLPKNDVEDIMETLFDLGY